MSVTADARHRCLPIRRIYLPGLSELIRGGKVKERGAPFRTSGTSFLRVPRACIVATFPPVQCEFRGASSPGVRILNTPGVKRIAKRALRDEGRRRRRGRKGNKNSLSAPGGCPPSVTAGYFFLWQSDKRRIFIPRVRAYLR